ELARARVLKRRVFGRVDGKQRQRYGERSAAPFAIALRGHRPAVKLHELMYDGQPKSEPSVLASRAAVRLTKPIKDVRQKVGSDALPRVLHGEFDVRVVAFEEDFN